MKHDNSSIDTVELEARIKEHCRNYRGKAKFNANEVAFDLQQKYFDYGKKKPTLFRQSVLEALTRLNLTDAPVEPEIIEEISIVKEMSKSSEGRSVRKRKADNNATKQRQNVDVIVSSDEEKDQQFEAYKTNNMANKSLLNLYNGNKTSSSPSVSKSQDKKKRAILSDKPEKSSSAQPRGLGNVTSLNILPRESTVKFCDLGGCDKQFLDVCRLAMHIKRPKTYGLLGVEPPKGLLVHGPPGCGKTLFAQAIAGEFGLPILQLAATELVSGVSGETEDKIRQLFETAKTHAPCVLVLDDVDSIAPRRETAQREMERRIVNPTLQFFRWYPEKPLSEKLQFDGNGDVTLKEEKESQGYVLVIGTTSRPDSLDNGLRRAGRFDCEISLGIPDEEARLKILNTICKLPLDDSVNMLQVARLTPGYVGADLNALVREAAKCAINRIFDNLVKRSTQQKTMTNSEIKEELDKVLAWLNNDDDPTVVASLGGFKVTISDFERALENVQPSAKREGFATVPDVTWADIGALSSVRQELEWNILYPVKRPEDFAVLGISTKPQGILLCGPPGCGKTLLAKAVANETGMNFISVKGPELLNMYVGESERAVRTVFQRARDSSPCVIFFDEIDALCPKRTHNESAGGARLVNQLLTEMDGVEGRKQVFLIGATNRPDIVDPAILRPGRLDKILFVDFPNETDRVDILIKMTKNRTHPRISDEVDFEEIAKMDEINGFTGADLAAVVHEASIIALKERLISNNLSIDAVGKVHFEAAVKKIRPSVSEVDRKKYERMKEVTSVCQLAMTFEPLDYELQQVLVLLQESQSGDTETQRRVQQKLTELQGHPKFCCYLVFILNRGDLPTEPRSLAGLILKNNIRIKWKSYEKYVQDYVKLNSLKTIGDPAPLIRATVGIIITTIFLEDNYSGWPDLLPTLTQLLAQPDYNLQEGALGAIQKVFEDSGDRLEDNQIQPMMLPILSFFSSESPKMRGLAMSSYNNILMVNSEPIAKIIDQYIPELFNRAHDNEMEVQRQLCRSLCLLLDAFMEKLVPHLPNIIDYIIVKSQDADENIALEACEFYLSLSENPDICKQVLQPVLPKLIPVLLTCMRYSDEDIAALKGDSEEDDMMQPDRDEDIKPRFHKGQNKGGTTEEDEEADEDDDNCTEWNIRRCSAASLDVLAGIFKNDILQVLLPCIQETLSNPDWRVKESGILALGAIAEGCMEGVRPHLPQLIPFLLQTSTEKKPLVRSISCWTLSRYCTWVVDEAKEQFMEPLIMVLLERILDGNKKVQEAACSAFASFEEESAEYLPPYLEQIVTVLVQAFRIYQAKNLLILYDALSTLAHSVSRAMAEAKYVETLMPVLMEKLMRVGNDDKEIFPLVECISAVATATGQHFLPYAEPIFNKCVMFVSVGVEQTLRATQHPEQYDMPEKDTHVVSLDLLSGIIESLGEQLHPLIQNSTIVQLVLASTMDANSDVRQSSFALLGDLVKTSWGIVKPFLGHFVAVITVNLDATNISVCNNAIWCLGEMSIRAGPDMKAFIPTILPYLIAIANKPNLQRTLLENTESVYSLSIAKIAALTLGRLGIYCAEETAPHLQTFVRACCTSLRNIKDNSEKYSAFQGLCNLINHNPAGIVHDFIFWCDAIASWNEIQPELKNNFIQILNAFRGHMGDENWGRFTAAFPPALRDRLAILYNV